MAVLTDCGVVPGHSRATSLSVLTVLMLVGGGLEAGGDQQRTGGTRETETDTHRDTREDTLWVKCNSGVTPLPRQHHHNDISYISLFLLSLPVNLDFSF